MALKTQKIVGDVGSQEMAQLIRSHNLLLDAMYALVTGLITAADITAVHALATTAEAAMASGVYKILPKANIPLSPAAPPA